MVSSMRTLISSDADIDTGDEEYHCAQYHDAYRTRYRANLLEYEVAQITDTHNFTTFPQMSL